MKLRSTGSGEIEYISFALPQRTLGGHAGTPAWRVWHVGNIPAEIDGAASGKDGAGIASDARLWKWCSLGMGLVRSTE